MTDDTTNLHKLLESLSAEDRAFLLDPESPTRDKARYEDFVSRLKRAIDIPSIYIAPLATGKAYQI